METIAQKELRSQEELVKTIQRDAEEYTGNVSIPKSSGKRSVEGLDKALESL